ncbi:hydrogenase formation protein HypD [Robertmurraya massiliosenegalensis]|uniref:hydrogenase formation protein HypD n=1 Tax=Robertmurraya TaxID=2837507 RepID=UPI0039A55AD2
MQELLDELSNSQLSRKLLIKVQEAATEFAELHGRKPIFMEVCGSHTMALAETGVKIALKDYVHLISGPGCPVCVTDQKSIDAMIKLAEGENRIICTFGDMIRVPGTELSLMEAKTKGKDIRIVYSPPDAVRIAEENPDKEVIFLGIGFETTIPVLAIALKAALDRGVPNFSMWMTTKLVEPILRTLLESKEVMIDGFLLPGHVSIILGKNQYQYLIDEYQIPGVISGFEPIELLGGLYKLIHQLLEGRVEIENDYPSVVSDKGNELAKLLLNTYFEPVDEAWRGIGVIAKSGMDIREEYAAFNAKNRFDIKVDEPRKTKCRCGEIIRGVISPEECLLFGKACTPVKPIGPCMVSAEGTCSAYYQFMRED